MTPPGWRMRWQGTTGVEDEMAGVGDNADRFTAWGICHALRKRKGYIERNVGMEGVENLGYHWYYLDLRR